MEQREQDIAETLRERRITEGRLLDGTQARYVFKKDASGEIIPGTERLEITLEQQEEIRREMYESFEQTVEDAVTEQNWEVVQKYAKMLATKASQTSESTENKLPEIADIGLISNLVACYISTPNEVEEVKNTLAEVEEILGTELSSYYELNQLTCDELSHLSKFLKEFYDNDGNIKKDFQRNLHNSIKEYIPKIFTEDWREDPVFKRQLCNHWEKDVSQFKEAIKEKDKTNRKIASKKICKLIVNDMCNTNEDHKIFVNKITDRSKFQDILNKKPMKIFITEYALYTKPKGTRPQEELKNCLDNVIKVNDYIERTQFSETEERENLLKKINGKVHTLLEKPNKNTAKNREDLMICLKKCLETIIPQSR